jgi:hypothetical protein
MPKHIFTVVCDYDGGTYVSQFEGRDASHVARQWSAMIRSDRPIPRSSAYIANRVIRDLDNGFPPVALDGLTNVWQMGAQVGRCFYTATLVKSA